MTFSVGASVITQETIHAGERTIPPFTPMTVVRNEDKATIVQLDTGEFCRIPTAGLKPFHDATVAQSQGTQVAPELLEDSEKSSDGSNIYGEWLFWMALVLIAVTYAGTKQTFVLYEQFHNDVSAHGCGVRAG